MQQSQGIVGMQAFIMMQRFISKSPKTQHRSKYDHSPERSPEQYLLTCGTRKSPRFALCRLLSLDFCRRSLYSIPVGNLSTRRVDFVIDYPDSRSLLFRSRV